MASSRSCCASLARRVTGVVRSTSVSARAPRACPSAPAIIAVLTVEPTSAINTTTAAAQTNVRCRCDHFEIRVVKRRRRAWIGSSRRWRPMSSANSATVL